MVWGELAFCWAGPAPRSVETLDRPVSRLIRSARSASRLLTEGLCWCPRRAPRWPSLMAVVERAEREVVVLVGVPLVMEHAWLAG